MCEHWLLTWTTYGTWLPGDPRGFVSNIDRGDGKGHRVNAPGEPPAANMPGLQEMAQRKMKGLPVWLSVDHARALIKQFLETVRFRGWEMIATAVMCNHVHIVLASPDDVASNVLMRDLKSYGSRQLNQEYERPRSGTWWTESGSRRRLPNEDAVSAAVEYVRNQENPLVVWVGGEWKRG